MSRPAKPREWLCDFISEPEDAEACLFGDEAGS